MVAGSFKELLTVAAGVVVFGDTFTAVNAAGIAILVAGVALFNIRKYRQMAAARAHRGYALATGGDSAEGERGEEGERVGEGEGGVGEASASGRSVGSVEPLWAGAMGTGGEDSGWEREEGSGEGAPCAKRGGDAEMEMSAVRHREREGGGKRDVEEGLNVGKRMSEVPLGDGVWEEG